MRSVPGYDSLPRVCPVAACGWGKQLPMWISEDQGSHGGVPDVDDVLRRRNHLQKVPLLDSQMGRGRGCWQETLGSYRCLSSSIIIVIHYHILPLSFPHSHFRANLRHSANMPKHSIPTRSITKRWRERTLYLWGGRSTSWYPITQSKISMVPPLQDFIIFASRNPPPR